MPQTAQLAPNAAARQGVWRRAARAVSGFAFGAITLAALAVAALAAAVIGVLMALAALALRVRPGGRRGPEPRLLPPPSPAPAPSLAEGWVSEGVRPSAT